MKPSKIEKLVILAYEAHLELRGEAFFCAIKSKSCRSLDQRCEGCPLIDYAVAKQERGLMNILQNQKMAEELFA